MPKDILAEAELLGLAELADLFGHSRPWTSEYVRANRNRSPEPVVVLACGPIWLRSDIEAWRSSPAATQPAGSARVPGS